MNILIKTAVENVKKNKKVKIEAANAKNYRILKDSRPIVGGYGANAGSYGNSPHTSYIDYGKLFSYLGKFKAKSMYENFENPAESINKAMELDNRFYLIDREVMDTGVMGMKYFTTGFTTGAPALPAGNINSADWEKFKMWMIVDYVMFNLKMRTM